MELIYNNSTNVKENYLNHENTDSLKEKKLHKSSTIKKLLYSSICTFYTTNNGAHIMIIKQILL